MGQRQRNSLILVGMPGAGKSTVGLLLAKELVKDFVDTDLLIQSKADMSLQDIIQERGYQQLRKLEEEVLLQAEFSNHIVATGGSVVYSDVGMRHLNRFGRVVFLDVPLEVLKTRLHNYTTRGIAAPAEQSLEELFEERRALYERYADMVVSCNNKPQHQVMEDIIYTEGEQFAEMDA